MAGTTFNPTQLPLQTTAEVQTQLDTADRRFMSLSCRESTSPEQKDAMIHWFGVKTQCSAELYRREARADVNLALDAHQRLFAGAV